MVSLKEADWDYILQEAPPPEKLEPEVAAPEPQPGLESADHAQIDKLIVSRAFARSKPKRNRHHHHKSFTRNEILIASAGGVVALLLLAGLIYLIQMM